MTQAEAIDRAREAERIFRAWLHRICAALPDTTRPADWLPAARRLVTGAADPELMARMMVDVAGLGLPVSMVRICAARAVQPTPEGLQMLLGRCESFDHIRVMDVAEGDDFRVITRADGTVSQIIHYRHGLAGEAAPPRGDWTHVFATAGAHHRPELRRQIVLTRAEAMAQAVEGLIGEVAFLDDLTRARYVAIIRLAHSLPLEGAWAPVRRLREAIGMVWSEA